ncbi:helix-turn-helix domain-containing protein [Mesorhizobium australicum]|uniref:Transcriptional regulator, Nlp family n=1 Tax=Mesorhizobium australicum TaxID=536018 RepID=A0A1X7NXV9_9HYPH|nr:helix-turn-helix domain-containing protein [Mesorhizobium australicum]SMH42158.1 transcriptional regulator, Nlp family [Mesorhizobium australicum]
MDTPSKWDRPAIVAEVHRRKMTLTGIAIDAGLYPSACRQGLLGKSRPGAEAIAAALDVPFRTLFPDSYSRGRHGESQTSSNVRCNGSAKAAPKLDTAAAEP